MFTSNRIPKIALLLLVIAVAYLASLVLIGQERVLDWSLSGDEMYLHEKLFALDVAGGGTATWILGIYRAYQHGSWVWLIACALAWPVAFFYTLAINTDGKP